MKIRILLLIILLLFVSCFKSEKQKKQDREKALQHIQQADYLFSKCEFNEALQHYLEAEDLGYDNPVAYYKMGFSYDKGPKNIKKAEKYYLKALDRLDVKKDLNNLAACYFHLAYIAHLHKDAGHKMEYFNSAYILFEKLLQKGQMRGEDYFRLGYYYYDKNEFKNARIFFNKAIKVFKNKNSTHIYYSLAYYNIAVTFMKEEEYEHAEWHYKQALNMEPENKMYQLWHKKASDLVEK